MAFKLSYESADVAKGSGNAICKKEETHRMAKANIAFAHFLTYEQDLYRYVDL